MRSYFLRHHALVAPEIKDTNNPQFGLILSFSVQLKESVEKAYHILYGESYWQNPATDN